MKSDRITRRDFFQFGAGIVGAVSALGVTSCGTQTSPSKKAIPVGLQLYSVRKDCEADLPKTIEAVAKMGYDGVEFAGFYKYSADELRKMLDVNRLKCCGSHTPFDQIQEETLAKTIEFNKIIGNKYLIIPWIPEERRKTEGDWIALAKFFSEVNDKIKPQGMRIGYHTHDLDFKPVDGKIPWDIFAQNTNPEVILQIDTGNAAGGGADPVMYLEKYPGRAVTVHIKEFSKTNPKAIFGEGDLNWKEIFNFCETAGGTEWYIIEEEKEDYPPLVCVDMCLKNFLKMKA
jgi:sugar phosphate isomerase/epimerase